METAAKHASQMTDDIHTRVVDVAADVTAVRTVNNLTIQSVLDALTELPPATLPDPPPTGYGGASADDVWSAINEYYIWPAIGNLNYTGIQQLSASNAGTALGQGGAFRYPDCPDFAFVCDDPIIGAANLAVIQDQGLPKPTGVNWSAWDGSETIVAFLNRVVPSITWSYVNYQGATTPGWAWGVPFSSFHNTRWLCLVTDDLLPSKAGVVPGGITQTKDYTVLSIAIGLASLFATGGGDVSAIVAELATLLADSTDIGAALTSLLGWLSGRDQSPNQEQGVQLVTALGDLDSLSADLLSDYNALALDISNAKSDLSTDISNVRGTNSPTIADVRSDLSTIRGDNATTLKGLSDKLDAISGKIDALGLPQPGYPGPDYVTFGDPVAITTDMTIEGPLDGAIYHVTAAPATLAKSNIGGFTSWYRLGQAAFESVDGYLDAFQQVNWDHGTLLPRGMLNPAALVLHWTGGVTGTVTPWVRN